MSTIHDLILLHKITNQDWLELKKLGIQKNFDIDKVVKILKKKLQPATSTTIPTVINNNSSSIVEHEASTNKISEELTWYGSSRGLLPRQMTSLVVTGFCKDIIQNLPMEFMVETKNLVKELIDVEGVG